MKRILCPFDFSETAYNAVVYAAQFAQERNAELVLYNVRLMFDFTSAKGNDSFEDSMEITAERLLKLTKEISRAFSISCYAEIEPATHNLATSIAERTETADIVIMGTNGADDLTQHFVGTNAYRAAVRSRAPLLIIPHGCKYKPLSSVLYAFDYGVKKRLPLSSLKKWIANSSANVTVLHVLHETNDSEENETVKTFEKQMSNQHREIIKKFESIFAVDTAEAIHDHVIEEQYDALVLCTVERNFLDGLFHKSVIRQLSAKATYPLFILHE